MEWNGRRFSHIPYYKISSIPYPFHTKNFPFHTKNIFQIPFHSSILMYSGVARSFKNGGHNFHTFFKDIFFDRTNLKLIEKQRKAPGSPRGPENF